MVKVGEQLTVIRSLSINFHRYEEERIDARGSRVFGDVRSDIVPPPAHHHHLHGQPSSSSSSSRDSMYGTVSSANSVSMSRDHFYVVREKPNHLWAYPHRELQYVPILAKVSAIFSFPFNLFYDLNAKWN